MLDEMTSLNASIFAISLEYKVKNLVGVCDFSYSKNMAKFEVFYYYYLARTRSFNKA